MFTQTFVTLRLVTLTAVWFLTGIRVKLHHYIYQH